MGIQAIIFDFGGVFTRSETTAVWLAGYDELLGLPGGTVQNALYSGEAWELASTGQITPSEHWERAAGPYEGRLPVDFRKLRQGLFNCESIDEEVVRLAQRLHRRYPLALCSNALTDLQEVLDSRPDIRQLFNPVIISSVVGLRKPNPAILQLTAERLALPVESCLLIDDKPRNTAVATALGMQAIVFVSAEQLANDLSKRGLLEDAS
jgi:putative hydrolase of the HAD superfamily